MTEIRKISVIGAGAIGATFGGLIKHFAPHVEVVLIARGEHCRVMQQRGFVELRGDWGRYDVPITASSDPDAVVGSDLVLFTVKTQDTAETAMEFANEIGDAIIVSLQNGINQHVLSKILPANRLLVGMTATNMAIVQPGVVVCQRRGISVIGAASDDVPASVVDDAHRILSKSGLPIEISSSIIGAQYNKLLFNTMGYASVLSATDFLREGIQDRDWRNHVARPILAEGLRVLDAGGISLQRVSGMSDHIRFERLMRTLGKPLVGPFVRMMMRGPFKPPQLVFSVYQDLLRQRMTEIDYINGEIVRLAEANDVDAPYNNEVVQLVHDMEDAAEPVFFTREQIATRFRQLG